MKILLSNDDGYLAPGLRCLAEAISDLAEITIVAPDRNRSGASNSLTLDMPLRVHRAEPNVYYVEGTPTDCVHLAITGLLDTEPDMVISGINDGPNLGDDVLYSGTVAAAMEGRFLGLPTMALSLVSGNNRLFETAGRVARDMLIRLTENPLPADTILNINVPDSNYEKISSSVVTRLGHRFRAEPVVRSKDPKGKEIFWIGAPGSGQDAGPGTDFHAVAQGQVSITPLQVDLTRHADLEQLSRWLEDAQ
ncbi:MAG: 5'/3'-nucleotidase SurE [Gammaproteobacteria bacterium]|nr:5'/3'-nucleotidase SurE [Gammaproteobacteria bacterium]